LYGLKTLLNVNNLFCSLLDDPALLDIELKKKLDANRKSAKSNMDKVSDL
jgi:hypothetical protein